MLSKILNFSVMCTFIFFSTSLNAQVSAEQLQEIVGEWKLDMSPEDSTDSNFATMTITEISTKSVKGSFYRDGVKMREGRVNTQRGIIYVALVSSDGSGDYNTSFYYKDGVLFGSTHSLERNFLSVWTATKNSQ